MSKSKGPAPDRCDCIEKMSSLLEEHNTRLVLACNIFNENLPAEMPTVETEKIDTKKRGKEKFVVVSFCPFCGRKYAQDGGEDDEDGATSDDPSADGAKDGDEGQAS